MSKKEADKILQENIKINKTIFEQTKEMTLDKEDQESRKGKAKKND